METDRKESITGTNERSTTTHTMYLFAFR